MKRIAWIGGVALVIGAALLTLETEAAVGDAVYRKLSGEVEITGTPLTQIGAFLTNLYPDASIGQAESITCSRRLSDNEVRCRAEYSVSVSETDFLDLDLAGKVPEGVDFAVGGGLVTFPKAEAAVTLNASQKANLAAWATANLGVADIDTLIVLQCGRRASGVVCESTSVVTGTPAEYAADRAAGLVVGRAVGKVE